MDNITEVVIRLAKQVEEHETQIRELLDAQVSMQKSLTVAFRETGFDFQKISGMESSRRQNDIRASTGVQVGTDEIDPQVQDELAKKILATLDLGLDQELGQGLDQDGAIKSITVDPRAAVTAASNKGRKQ